MPNKHVKKCNQNYVIRNTFCSKYPNRHFPYWKILFLSSVFKKAVAQKLCLEIVVPSDIQEFRAAALNGPVLCAIVKLHDKRKFIYVC